MVWESQKKKAPYVSMKGAPRRMGDVQGMKKKDVTSIWRQGNGDIQDDAEAHADICRRMESTNSNGVVAEVTANCV